jgi:hypothetical protein
MPSQNLEDGLYLAKRPVFGSKVADHYGVIDIGNRLRYALPPALATTPVVIHQAADGLKAESLTGEWHVESRIADEAGAIRRIETAMATPNYDLFGNNCEHFARFVASGTKESKQLQVVVLLGAAAVAMWGISNLNNAGTT